MIDLEVDLLKQTADARADAEPHASLSSHRTAGIADAEIAELSAEFVPEDVGARVGGHLVDFDRGALGVERDPADLDHRGPGRDPEAIRLGRQRHPGADVLTEPRGCVAQVGQARVNAARTGLGLGDWGARGDGGHVGRERVIRRALNRIRPRAVAQGETYPKLGVDTGR
jgi:hypothetical protein